MAMEDKRMVALEDPITGATVHVQEHLVEKFVALGYTPIADGGKAGPDDPGPAKAALKKKSK